MAGTVGAVVTCPLEVVKTRLQSSAARTFPTRAPTKLMAHIVRTEGATALWKGVGPNILGVAPARAIYFGVYSRARALMAEGEETKELSPLQHLMCAGAAGASTICCTSPIWVVKTRLQLQRTVLPDAAAAATAASAEAAAKGDAAKAAASAAAKHKTYAGFFDAVRTIAREEGFRAFYRGTSASFLGVTESALQFGIYNHLKGRAAENVGGVDALGHGAIFGLAALSKVSASVLTYPHEVVRTRMRERSVADNPERRTLRGCFKYVYETEGRRGLYGGMRAHLYRVVPNAAIMVLVVETLVGL
eukprot:PLAT10445.1.p1 GENE.PLAT10445.1~~PLAT10445.1.p1  ORF type:complete len:325 (+),score=77.59 PLAT10445.1:66-977(+)